MSWHYGIIRKTNRFNGKTTHHYEIHEVFDVKGKLLWTEQPIRFYGENIKELQHSLAMALQDSFKFPVYEIRKNKLIKRGK